MGMESDEYSNLPRPAPDDQRLPTRSQDAGLTMQDNHSRPGEECREERADYQEAGPSAYSTASGVREEVYPPCNLLDPAYISRGHVGPQIPHIVIDPGDPRERYWPPVTPLNLQTQQRKLTVLTLAAKKQRAHSDSILETNISDSGQQLPDRHKHSSSCSDAPTELSGLSIEEQAFGPQYRQRDQQGALNLAVDRAVTDLLKAKGTKQFDKPKVPFIWKFKKQSEEASSATTTYWLRRYSDSNLPTDPEDLSTSPSSRSLSTGDSNPPCPIDYSHGVLHKRLKLKKYLQTRYQSESSLEQESYAEQVKGSSGERKMEDTIVDQEVTEMSKSSREYPVQSPTMNPVSVTPRRDPSPNGKKPAPLSFLPESVTRQMMTSVSDSEVEPEPETPVFTPHDVFSPAPVSRKEPELGGHGLRFRFSTFDSRNMTLGETRMPLDVSPDSSSIMDEPGLSPLGLSPAGLSPSRLSPSQKSPSADWSAEEKYKDDSSGHSAGADSPISQSPASEGGRPQKLYATEPSHFRPGRFLSSGHPLVSPLPPQDRSHYLGPTAPLSAPPFLGESAQEMSPFPGEPGRSVFTWTPMPPHTPEKSNVHFFPPEFFPSPGELERISALQARSVVTSMSLAPSHSSSQTQQHSSYYAPIASSQASLTSPVMSPPSHFPAPMTLKIEPPSSPKPDPQPNSRKVHQCHFAEQIIEQQLGGPGGAINYVCPVCGQMFHSYNYLANHMVNHLPSEVLPKGPGDNNKIHLCKVCNRSFSRSDMLTRHMRLHTGLRPYECQVCGQVFSRSDHLHTHLRTHTGEKPYKCPQCPYAAPRRDMITRHLRIHMKQVVRRGRRSYSASSASGSREETSRQETHKRNQSLSSIDTFESSEPISSVATTAFPLPDPKSVPRNTSLTDSVESPLPSTPSIGSFDLEGQEIPSDSGCGLSPGPGSRLEGYSPGPGSRYEPFGRREGYRRARGMGSSSLGSTSSGLGEESMESIEEGTADSPATDTDIQKSFHKCTMSGDIADHNQDSNV